MAGFTLFPAETGVKLTLQRRAAMIAPMRSRVACVAVIGLVAAAGCNEGLSPTPACPRGFVGMASPLMARSMRRANVKDLRQLKAILEAEPR